MYDYGLSVMEQYGITVTGSYRGRGALMCKSREGIFCLRPFEGSEKRLMKQQELLLMLKEKHGMWVDAAVPSIAGDLVVRDQDNIAYVLRYWYEGRECDTRLREDVVASAKMLGTLHSFMHMPPAVEYVSEPLGGEYERHNRELRKILKFIQKKHPSNPFERLYVQSVEEFIEWGREALELLEKSCYSCLRKQALERGLLCHGEFNQHHVIMGSTIAVTGFEKWRYDLHVTDVYSFMRKILEKYNWDKGLGRQLLEAYEEKCPLSKEEKKILGIRFAYPEKYWKLANYYYTHNKAWISGKNVEKLHILMEQKKAWRDFVEDYLRREE